eukprot:CAMPEP_0184301806 /NCGR_PEP_ID=MMETSP1049-20130417/11928_1 /TAXON_ID=77928 /ORGANISM="Proteomonas sulcata, Strain CCMP704" /LENGTH=61 /DNA_ID=CAMNT_0026612915 /DNA_START=285 /DNA_END=466 /DNA_ORIENTATION=-
MRSPPPEAGALGALEPSSPTGLAGERSSPWDAVFRSLDLSPPNFRISSSIPARPPSATGIG